ncbi:hypothetical protein [Micromonospora musae]|nr:hypothetical protein [Micromonospora musae]
MKELRLDLKQGEPTRLKGVASDHDIAVFLVVTLLPVVMSEIILM